MKKILIIVVVVVLLGLGGVFYFTGIADSWFSGGGSAHGAEAAATSASKATPVAESVVEQAVADTVIEEAVVEESVEVFSPTELEDYKFQGSGTKSDPYLISTAKDMWALSDATQRDPDNREVIFSYFEDTYFKMTCDIDLGCSEDKQWWPIGPSYINDGQELMYSFGGHFDGGGFMVSGLYVNYEYFYFLGLFGGVGSRGSVSNLGVSGYVKGRVSRCGTIAGVNGGLIVNCYSNVECTSAISNINEGGIIINCYSIDMREKPDAKLKSKEFLAELNKLAGAYNGVHPDKTQALGWKTGSNGYPVLQSGSTPPVSDVSFNKGSGTQSDPYIMDSREQMELLSLKTAVGYKTDGVYFKMTCDIDLGCTAKKQWLPINSNIYEWHESDLHYPFDGHFDGGGFKISGLYIDNNLDYQGLFGGISYKGSVSNLGVSGYVKGGNCVGGVTGFNVGKIYNSYSTVQVKGNMYIGGVAGSGNFGKIYNSYSTAQVRGNENIGGVAGFSYGEDADNCYSLEGCVEPKGEHYVNGTVKTEEEMKSAEFVSELNRNIEELRKSEDEDIAKAIEYACQWAQDTTPLKNNGYPIFLK